MPVNFPNSPSNDDEHSANGLIYKYNSTKGAWKRKFVAPTDATDINQLNDSSGLLTSSSTNVVADMAALIALTGMSSGDQAYVTANNKLYFYNGSGWYLIATVQNDAPSAITGVNGTYELAIDGTATTITAVSTDPEGFPLTWSYSTSGLGSIATVSNTDGVFTITPSTTEADAGTFSLTINATDGINGAVSTSTNLTLEFIVIVANSRYTTLLATATGTSDNNNITDASTNNHTITVTGDAYAGTFSPYRSGGYSTEFQGVSTQLVTQSFPTGVTIGTDNYTVEFFVWRPSTQSTNDWLIMSDQGSAQLRVRIQTSGALEIYMNGVNFTTSTTVGANAWHHVCMTRGNSNAITVYLDGTSIHTQTGDSTSLNSTNGWKLAGHNSAQNMTAGLKIRDLRVVKGSVIVPPSGGPTEPLTEVTGTYLTAHTKPYLSHKQQTSASDSTLVEKPFATVTGTVETKPFGPYDYTEYSVADNGGSIYADGSSGASFSQISLSATFTVECWFYITASDNTWQTLFFNNSPFKHFVAKLTSSGIELQYYQNITHQTKTSLNTWNHAALVSDGTNIYVYLNGVRSTNSVAADNFFTDYLAWRNSEELIGYIADARIIDGTAVYSGASFTPPTAPLSSSGAELHIKGTDASIIDKSQGGNLKLVGNTTGSTAQVKFASSKSMYFDAAGDYISIPVDEVYGFGTDDWTIETWLYCTKTGGFNAIFDTRVGTGTQAGNFGIGMYNTGRVQLFSGGIFYYPTDTLSFNTWQHLAVVKNSGTTTMYFNGTAASSTYSDSRNYGSSQPVQIGKDDTTSNYFGGYMQDFRISKGLARYTANFTPPTAPLEG